MKKALIVVILCLVMCSGVLALDDISIFNSSSMTIEQSIANSIHISQDKIDNVQWIRANLSFVAADDYRSHVIETIVYPKPLSQTSSDIVFEWQHPTSDIMFGTHSTIKTKSNPYPVTQKIEFPLKNIPDTVKPFLTKTPLIDINDDIKRTATTIANGSDDEYIIASTIAAWVSQNIAYDLNTITADATKPASWVLEKREGVCDELTTLYIAMMRSQGIPARFVAGISYTNSKLFETSWSPHAWAEVYFPDTGWVPFDLTYKQYGYLDPSHITLKTSVDADESRTIYSWKGTNVDSTDITLQQLNFSTNIISIENNKQPNTKATLKVIRDNVAFGSNTLIQVTIENLKNTYLTQQITLSAPKEVTIDNSKRTVILHPYQTQTLFFYASLDNNLDKRSVYTFPFILTQDVNQIAAGKMTASDDAPSYSIKELESIQTSLSQPQQTIVTCAPSGKVYINEPFDIVCKSAQTATICDAKECKTGTQITFRQTLTALGDRSIILTMKEPQTKTLLTDIVVIDRPKIVILNIMTQKNISYDQHANLTFVLEKKSTANPKDVQITIGKPIGREISLGTMATSYNLTIEFEGRQLWAGENDINITITYKDDDQQIHTETGGTKIDLVNISFGQWILLYLGHFFAWFNF